MEGRDERAGEGEGVNRERGDLLQALGSFVDQSWAFRCVDGSETRPSPWSEMIRELIQPSQRE